MGILVTAGVVLLLTMGGSGNGKTKEDKEKKPAKSQESETPQNGATSNAPQTRPPRGPRHPRPDGPGSTIPPVSGVPIPARRDIVDPVGQICSMTGHDGPVLAVAYSPDGIHVLTGGEDGTVRMWDVDSVGETRRFTGSAHPVHAVAFSPDANLVVASTGTEDPPEGEILFWETGSGTKKGDISVSPLAVVRDVAFSHDGKFILLAGADSTVRRIEVVSYGKAGLFTRHGDAVLSVAFSPSGKRAISGSADHSVCLWNTADGELIHQMQRHAGPVNSVAYSADGMYALSGSTDKTLGVWDLSTGKLLRRITGHQGEVTAVAWSPLGDRFLSASTDGTVRLWNAADGAPLHRFDGHTGPVRDVAFDFGGYRAVSTGDDGTVRLWGLPRPDKADPQGGDPDDPAGAQARLSLPDAQSLGSAEAFVKEELFKTDFTPGAAATHDLAARLTVEAGNGEHNAATVYTLWKLAAETEAIEGNADKAFATIGEITRRFDTDGLVLKGQMLNTITNASRPAITPLVAQQTLALIDEATASDQYDLAAHLVGLARKVAAKRRDGIYSRLVSERAEQIATMQTAFDEIRPAKKQLETQPDDPEANEAVGKFYCCIKGDWKSGLPMLALAENDQWRDPARSDLIDPPDAQARLAVADAWWNLAQQQQPVAKHRVQERAIHWYKLAEPSLTGTSQTRARHRIGASAGTGTADQTALLPRVKGLDSRSGTAKAAYLAYFGGTTESEAAVDRALAWIAAHQQADGSWTFDHDNASCMGKCPNPGSHGKKAPIAATAIALLPLLGADNTARSGKYRANVQRGLNYLMNRIVAVGPRTGSLYETDGREMMPHALATIAFCEAFTLQRDKTTQANAQAAANFIEQTQNEDGGWGPRPKKRDGTGGDASTMAATVWSLAALKAAERAGFRVSADVTDLATSFLDDCDSDDHDGFTGKPGGGTSEPHATAAGYVCRLYTGWPPSHAGVSQFVGARADAGPATDGDVYLNYFANRVMRQAGGDPWKKWNPALRDHLLATQGTADHAKGSWFIAANKWGTQAGGRLFATAMSALILENYYRHPVPRE